MISKFKQHHDLLKLSEYQTKASNSNQFKAIFRSKDYLRFGFFGEVGGLLSLVKKANRELQDADHLDLIEELGDALWYLTTITIDYEFSLQDIGGKAIGILGSRFNISNEYVNDNLTFDEFDGLIKYAKPTLSKLEIPDVLKKLGTDCGTLLAIADTEESQDQSSKKVVFDLLAELLADLVITSAIYGLQFDRIANENINKTESKWPPENTPYIPLFDEDYSEMEKFPRSFSIEFIEEDNAFDRPFVIQRMNKVNIGDPLNDNRSEPDGYRFHDVFHLSYLVHLGWSPVIRALLKLKRKSKPNIDQNEDGARAIIIEEGIATWIFNHASHRELFQTVEMGRLNYGLLKQVHNMVDGYEVHACPLWQWERAILDGFAIFRQLVSAGGGIVNVSLIDRTIKFEAAPPRVINNPVKKPRQIIIGAATPKDE